MNCFNRLRSFKFRFRELVRREMINLMWWKRLNVILLVLRKFKRFLRRIIRSR